MVLFCGLKDGCLGSREVWEAPDTGGNGGGLAPSSGHGGGQEKMEGWKRYFQKLSGLAEGGNGGVPGNAGLPQEIRHRQTSQPGLPEAGPASLLKPARCRLSDARRQAGGGFWKARRSQAWSAA